MSNKSIRHSILLATILVAVCSALGASATTQLCLGLEAAIQAEAATVVLCGFPKPTYSSSGGTTDVPIVCHRRASEIGRLLRAEAGFQGLEDAAKICYMKIQPYENTTVLNMDLIKSNYDDVPSGRKIRLTDSVAETVGISASFAIKGPVSSINPAVFADTGPAQRDKLKNLFLAYTNLNSLDLALLEPLKFNDLMLLNNTKLTRIVNYKNTRLSNMKAFILWNNSPSLVDCRNLLALPSTVEKVAIFQDGLKDNCAQCHLPVGGKNKKQLLVKKDEPSLKYWPGLAATTMDLPYPVDQRYGILAFLPSVLDYKIFNYNATSAAPTCQSECSCQKWAPPVDSTKNSVSTGGGSSSGGTASGTASGSTSTGTGKEMQTIGGNNSAGGLCASTALIVIALALFRELSLL